MRISGGWHCWLVQQCLALMSQNPPKRGSYDGLGTPQRSVSLIPNAFRDSLYKMFSGVRYPGRFPTLLPAKASTISANPRRDLHGSFRKFLPFSGNVQSSLYFYFTLFDKSTKRFL